MRATRYLSTFLRLTGVDHRNEIIFQNIIQEVVRLHGFGYVPFPVRAAANYSILYLLYRIMTESEISRVLEFGAGESTLFLDRMKTLRDFSLTTVEHDSLWCDQIRPKVGHEVILSALSERELFGNRTKAYDLAPLADRKFDLVVVDGPQGTRHRSRWGALEVLDNHLADEFIVIFDDAERRGELETVKRALELFAERKKEVFLNVQLASKAQAVIATAQYRFAQFL